MGNKEPGLKKVYTIHHDIKDRKRDEFTLGGALNREMTTGRDRRQCPSRALRRGVSPPQ